MSRVPIKLVRRMGRDRLTFWGGVEKQEKRGSDWERCFWILGFVQLVDDSGIEIWNDLIQYDMICASDNHIHIRISRFYINLGMMITWVGLDFFGYCIGILYYVWLSSFFGNHAYTSSSLYNPPIQILDEWLYLHLIPYIYGRTIHLYIFIFLLGNLEIRDTRSHNNCYGMIT